MSSSDLSLKCLVYLATAVSVHVSLSPPNPPVKKDRAVPNTMFEKFIQSITFITKSMVWTAVGWDLFVSVTSYLLQGSSDALGSVFVTQLCGGDPSALWTVHPIMIAASLTTVFAAFLRAWCFKSLGTLFTFEISIQDDHALVTSGPYSWVRHPSYTGVFMTLLGSSALWIAPGGWIRECGTQHFLFVGAFLIVWTIKCFYAMKGTLKRITIEDQALKKEFGQRWDQWARNVPQVLIPYLL